MVGLGVALLSLAACAGSPKATSDGRGCPEMTESLRLVGAPALVAQLKRAEMKRGLLVRYQRAKDGCGLSLELLECRAPGDYVYRPGLRRHTYQGAGEAWMKIAPLMPPQAGARWRIEESTAGRWLFQGQPPVKSALTGACGQATHLVQAVVVGAYRLDETTPAGLTRVRPVGKTSVCRGSKRPPPGCALPLRLALRELPLAPPTPDPPKVKLDLREVSAAEYAACVKAGRCPQAKRGGRCTAGSRRRRNHPANCVSWAGAKAYCAYKGQRLPSALEWLNAAGGARFSWGEAWPPPAGAGNFADASARAQTPYWTTIDGYKDGHAATAPVGHSEQDGLKDLAGNVMEWTSTRQKGGVVVRGSSFGHARPEELDLRRVTIYKPSLQSAHVGFRCTD